MCGAIPTQCETCGTWWRIKRNCECQNNKISHQSKIKG